jgi:hypothetical protein
MAVTDADFRENDGDLPARGCSLAPAEGSATITDIGAYSRTFHGEARAD